jgi:hypothetical protein
MSNSQHRQKIYSINILQVVFYIDRFIVYKCYNKTCANSWTAPTHWILLSILHLVNVRTGADPGGAHPARAPPKIGKNKIFWRKIVFFHTKYPKNVHASLCSAQFFKVRPPPNLKSWIRPWRQLCNLFHIKFMTMKHASIKFCKFLTQLMLLLKSFWQLGYYNL